MPYKENIALKRYWSIGELAKDMNTSTSLIRFYEKEIGMKANRGVRKNLNGHERKYLRSQYNDLVMLISLMRTKRFTVYGGWEYIKEYRKL